MLSTFFAGNSDLQRRLLQAREQSAYTMWLNVFTALVISALSIALVAGLRYGAMGMMLAEFGANIVLYSRRRFTIFDPELKGASNGRRSRAPVKYAAGVLPSQVIGTVSWVATRSILVGYQSLAALGEFALASRFARPLSILILAFATAYTPIYFAARKEGSEASHAHLAQVTAAVWLLGVWGCLGVSTFGPSLILVMTPERFHAAAPLVPWLAVGWMAQVLSVVGNSEICFPEGDVVRSRHDGLP